MDPPSQDINTKRAPRPPGARTGEIRKREPSVFFVQEETCGFTRYLGTKVVKIRALVVFSLKAGVRRH